MAKDDPKRAAKALILFEDKYLFLVRNDRDDVRPSGWDLPGGGVEPGETVNEALVREVKEETGIDISSAKTFIIKNWRINKVSGTDFLCILDEPREIKLSAEHVRAQWFSKKEVADSAEIPVWLKDDVERAVRLAKRESKSWASLIKELKSKANLKKARILQKFFKTGPGEYGQGDVFLGVVVPETRKIARKYAGLNLKDVINLLHSKIHEERLAALLIMVSAFAKATADKDKIYNLYLKNTKYINNWDLVDLSAHKIVGEYLSDKPKSVLYRLARSKNIWERRIAVIATFSFIKNNRLAESLKLAEMLLEDKHDLIHKAVGWMLREVGKKDSKIQELFLKKHYKKMPRTMLRYAIERLPERKRLTFLR